MGRAARSNPLSLAGQKDPDQVSAARLARFASRTIKTPRQFATYLESFPEDAREEVRRLTLPHCEWDLALIRREEAVMTKAAAVAAQAGGSA
jgi:hypothetical protein